MFSSEKSPSIVLSCVKREQQAIFRHPNDHEFSKNPKKISPRILNQLHQFALANVLAQLVMKIDFRSLKQQLRMVEIFYFSCNQCRGSNVFYEKGQNVVFSKTIPALLLSPYNHRERVKRLILFRINVIHFYYRQRPQNCSEYFFQMPSLRILSKK